MIDNLSKDKRSKIMRSIHQKDTKPEIAVRKILTSLGYRYRLHSSDLPGRPDIVFRGKRKVIFVHGCFWHSHKGCKLSHIPDITYWKNKLRDNKKRDKIIQEKLVKEGWSYLIIWECEIANSSRLTETIIKFLGPPHQF